MHRKPHPPLERRRVAIEFDPDDNLTHQSFKDECDVNRIVDQYARTGIVSTVQTRQPYYGENPTQSYHEALCMAAEAASALQEGLPTDPDDSVDSEAPQAEIEGVPPEEAPPEVPPESNGGTS